MRATNAHTAAHNLALMCERAQKRVQASPRARVSLCALVHTVSRLWPRARSCYRPARTPGRAEFSKIVTSSEGTRNGPRPHTRIFACRYTCMRSCSGERTRGDARRPHRREGHAKDNLPAPPPSAPAPPRPGRGPLHRSLCGRLPVGRRQAAVNHARVRARWGRPLLREARRHTGRRGTRRPRMLLVPVAEGRV